MVSHKHYSRAEKQRNNSFSTDQCSWRDEIHPKLKKITRKYLNAEFLVRDLGLQQQGQKNLPYWDRLSANNREMLGIPGECMIFIQSEAQESVISTLKSRCKPQREADGRSAGLCITAPSPVSRFSLYRSHPMQSQLLVFALFTGKKTHAKEIGQETIYFTKMDICTEPSLTPSGRNKTAPSLLSGLGGGLGQLSLSDVHPSSFA